MHRSCPLVPANGISKSPGHLKIPNLNSKLREKICFKYSRFEEKDSNIRILFGLQNSRIRIRIFEIRGKRFESESNPNIFDHLWFEDCWQSNFPTKFSSQWSRRFQTMDNVREQIISPENLNSLSGDKVSLPIFSTLAVSLFLWNYIYINLIVVTAPESLKSFSELTK